MFKGFRPPRWAGHVIFCFLMVIWAVWIGFISWVLSVHVHWSAGLVIACFGAVLAWFFADSYIEGSRDDGPMMARLAARRRGATSRKVITLPAKPKQDKR